MLRSRFYLFTRPADIEALLTANGYDVVKGRGLRMMRALLGLGLLTSDEPLHLAQRRLVQPAFARDRMPAYAATMAALSMQAVDAELRDGTTVVLDVFLNRLALRIAADTLFGANVDADAASIARSIDRAMAIFPAAMHPVGSVLRALPFHPVARRFREVRAELDRVVYRLIATRRAEGTDRGDLLSRLLTARDEGGAGMTDEQVRDEVVTLLLAGHETTANALVWALDQLARTPAALAALEAELDTVLGDRDPAPADVPALRCARDVIAEALRLRPPAWILGRRTTCDVRIGDWTLPKGAIAIAAPLLTHRDPALWREPEAFRPERWSNGETDGLPRYAYRPFGGGNRVCIGEAFAWTEAVLMLAAVVHRVRLTPVDPSPLPLAPIITLRPGRPVLMRVEARRQPVPV